MAAPRLHLSNIASRNGQSEDEEVEVLQSGIHDDDLEISQSTFPSVDNQRRHSRENTANLIVNQPNMRPAMQVSIATTVCDSPLADDRRSETSTPEADGAEAIMAALYSSTASDAVPDHQEASDRLQDKSYASSTNGSGSRSRPSNIRAPGSSDSPSHSTPTVAADPGPETLPSRNEVVWNTEEMRGALRFFYLNPVEKYRTTRKFPWKLALQVIKIFIVTAQLIVYGDMRMGHATFASKTETALRHLFLANWTNDRDLLIYPPTVPPFSIYEIDDFYNHLTYAMKKYYILPNVSVATLVYDCQYGYEQDASNVSPQGGEHSDQLIRQWNHSNDDALSMLGCKAPPMTLCVELLQAAESHLANRTYHYDMRTITTCVDVDMTPEEWSSDTYTVRDALAEHNVTIHRQRFVKATLIFKLKTIHLKRLQPADEPDCFHLLVNILYDNSAHTGDILVGLDATQTFILCDGSIEFPTYNVAIAALVALLDAIVLCTCVASLMLCVRAVIRARRLCKRTNEFFCYYYGHELSKDDCMKFVNFWYILILINDVCLIMGTVFKFMIEYQSFNGSLFTATGMLLGLGTLIVWIGVLRYLAFFPKYNVLIITLKRSLPNVLRFMACAGLLYAGFVFCGWVVLGPYHMKFRTLMMTSECLFALLNGDDMFATFSTTSATSPAVQWFARLYIYAFISLFTYVVLSLFISIIMEAYEVIKDRQQYQPEQSHLDTFIGISQLNDDNSAAAGTVNNSFLPDTPSPGSSVPRVRRRLSRQRSSHAEDSHQPYVRFEDEPVIITDSQSAAV